MSDTSDPVDSTLHIAGVTSEELPQDMTDVPMSWPTNSGKTNDPAGRTG